MCGRFVSASPPDELARYFGVDELAERVLDASYNVAPTSDVYVVLETGGVRRLDALHWGLVPFWAKDRKVGQRMINARSETLAESGAYKHAFRKRRCLVPADGFFEWRRDPDSKRKQPMYIHRADGEPLAFAGLWEVWKPRGPEGDDDPDARLRSCTIVTGPPNDLVAGIHDRMPVMLPPSAWDPWLDPDNDDVDTLGRLLVPAPSELFVAHPVTTRVNNVRNDDSALIEPWDPGEQAALPGMPPGT